MQIYSNDEPMTMAHDGAQLCAGAAASVLHGLRGVAEATPPDRAGRRIDGTSKIARFLEPTGLVASIARRFQGHASIPVRAILFEKSAAANWSLGWHQDRTICVQEQIETDGFGPWSMKGGMIHVEPPYDLLARMVTLRIHLDDVPASNAPLLVAPGSHRLGRIPASEIAETVERCGTRACLAEAGDVWAYATPILHASEAAMRPSHRRVLQVDFAVETLPEPLRWRGLDRSASA